MKFTPILTIYTYIPNKLLGGNQFHTYNYMLTIYITVFVTRGRHFVARESV
jgi:hypothetical protein